MASVLFSVLAAWVVEAVLELPQAARLSTRMAVSRSAVSTRREEWIAFIKCSLLFVFFVCLFRQICVGLFL